METLEQEKKRTPPKRPAYGSLRVRRETRRRIVAYLEAINKKEFGRRIRPEEILNLALNLITPQHLHELQEASLTNADRLERDFRTHVAKHGALPRDEYLGRRLTGEIPPTDDKNPLTGQQE